MALATCPCCAIGSFSEKYHFCKQVCCTAPIRRSLTVSLSCDPQTALTKALPRDAATQIYRSYFHIASGPKDLRRLEHSLQGKLRSNHSRNSDKEGAVGLIGCTRSPFTWFLLSSHHSSAVWFSVGTCPAGGSSVRRYAHQQLALCALCSAAAITNHIPLISEAWWHYYFKCQCQLLHPVK